MKKRELIIGDYHTAADGLWTLASLKLSPATHDQELVKVPGSSVTLDLSTALTDGEPTYSPRTIEATLESSEGNRLARKARIDEMINRLDGYTFKIILPDDPDRYMFGRVSVAEDYNDPAHAAVTLTATVEPWKYAATETVINVPSTGTEQTITLFNKGRQSVIPTIEVSGDSVGVTYNGSVWSLDVGTYIQPDVYLTTGEHTLTISGAGDVTFTYREAVL